MRISGIHPMCLAFYWWQLSMMAVCTATSLSGIDIPVLDECHLGMLGLTGEHKEAFQR